MNRREFIRMMGGVTAVTAGLTLIPASIRHALTIGANNKTGTIQDVQHVVILMQENRSFDHYFGTLRGVRGFRDRFPVPTVSGKPAWHQSNGAREILPFRFDKNTMNAALVASMPHTFPDAQAAWGQGQLSFWPKYKTDASMGYYTREEAPFQYALADAFTICDAYHCSVQASTGPNRIVFWSGTNFDPTLRDLGINCDESQSEPMNLRSSVSGKLPYPGYSYTGSPFLWETIPELLESAGVSWKIYQDPNDNWGGLMHGCLASPSFRNAKPGSPYYEEGMCHYSVDDLKGDVMANRLPSVSWILPQPLKSEHPGAPSSSAQGGNFVEQVLQALTTNPEVWSKTVFFLAFDENDGFFDHIPPPAIPSRYGNGSLAGKATLDVNGMYFAADRAKHLHSSDVATSDLRPWGMGPRVPMYVISPWSRGGWVNSQVFDHTSVGMFLEKRFGITIRGISNWHRAISGDLTSALDFVRPNNSEWPKLPDMSGYALIERRSKMLPDATAPDTPQPLYQEPGIRYSRALPYELQVNATVHSRGGIALEFVNSGTQGAVFHVYDKHHLDQIPRRYTVEAGLRIDDDYWNPMLLDNGHYDLEVHGPNGFFRSFKGCVVKAHSSYVETKVSYDVINEGISLGLRNAGTDEIALTIVANAYRNGDALPVLVSGRSDLRKHFSLTSHGNWYDFTVKGADFERRFAGRMETGGPSISDPAVA